MSQKSRTDLTAAESGKPVVREADDNLSVGAFLDQVKRTPVVRKSAGSGRLVFALDATMSRDATWDMATSLQSEMFLEASKYTGLDVQLVYFRGPREVFKSQWSRSSEDLLNIMSRVRCRAGRTQLNKVLRHVERETRTNPVRAFVFVGDSFEEHTASVIDTAGRLGLLGVRGFIFQEGRDAAAERVFRRIADLTNGAYAKFDSGSASTLKDLLRAAAAYASGGVEAVKKLSGAESNLTRLITQQLSD